jgi:methyl-accepting chemotaxis protein
MNYSEMSGNANKVMEALDINPQSVQVRKEWLQLEKEDENRINRLGPKFTKHADNIIDRLYDHFVKFTETKRLLPDEATIRRLKGTQKDYFEGIFNGNYDTGYVEKRVKIGLAHVRVDLKPQWYLGAYNLYLRLVMEALFRESSMFSKNDLLNSLQSLSKVIFFDMGLAIDSYIGTLTSQIIEERDDLKRRIEQMKEVCLAIAAGDLSKSVEVDKGDAVGELGEALNQMSDFLREMAEAANRIGSGDLTVQITPQSDKDMFGNAFKGMIERLQEIMGNVNGATAQVSTAADQIAEANQNFSQRITEQAASIEETSATMEEMSASIKHTADNAREANRLVQAAKSSAEAGSAVMRDTIGAMDEINKSSSRIANISNMIEEIAFQTNLLALNAAVEAARAGEHGKGFAVVASEIRNLAQRASQSAKDITRLIEESVDKTGRGVSLAEGLSKKLEEIGLNVKKVADLMDEVAAAAGEQASGINQTNTAISQVDQMTQQNAALVEETSASAEEMAAQAKELMSLVSFFKTGLDEKTPMRASYRPSVKKALPALAYAERNEKSNGGFEEF